MIQSIRRYMIQPWFLFIVLYGAKLAFTRSEIVESGLAESLFIELPVLILVILSVEWILQSRPRHRFMVYLLVNMLLSIICFALIVYYQYFHTLATYTSLFDLNQTGDVSDSIAFLIEPRFYLLFLDLPVILLSVLAMRIIAKMRPSIAFIRKPGLPIRNRYGGAMFLGTLVLALLHVLQAIGGGTVNELMKARGMGFLTYQAYAVYVDAKHAIWQDMRSITPSAIHRAKGIKLADEPFMNGIAGGRDVYVVQLESFNNFVIGLEVEGREITPNLNRLVESSIYFDHVYQQIGKGNTSDAEFVMNTSLYPSGTMPMSRQTAGLEVPSLPRYLSPYGYESVTLHTNDAKFWDRADMYRSLGFDAYYDKEYFGEEDKLHFGASDEVLYQKSIDIFLDMKDRGNRIYANLISMSSHNPFKLPEDKRMLELPDELVDTFIGDYLESIYYADFAFGLWVEEMKRSGLWDEALIVVYGDHFGVPDTAPSEELATVAELIGVPYYSKAEMFNVPLIIHMPGIAEGMGMVRHNTGGQIDILPTVLNLLGIRYDDKIIFGQDLLNHEHNLIGQRTYLPSGSFINDEVIFIPGKGIEDGWLVPLDDPELAKRPPTSYADDYHRALRLLQMSDAFIASLSQQAVEAVPVNALETAQEAP